MRENGLRVTQARIDVATILLNNLGSPLSPEEVFNKINSSQKMACDQVSVYRILAKFDELGIVTKSQFQGEAARYMVDECGKVHEHHHHFFKCRACGMIEPFDGCFIGKKEKDLESKGYTALKHHIEITGICPKCS
jgi:Fe2+ or Zn2+ uptake regulation protein